MVFDVEGVLIPKNRLFFDVGRSLGVVPLLKILLYGFLYEVGAMRLTEALEGCYKVTRGAKVELFIQSYEALPLIPNAKEIFAGLRAENCKTALISSGMPTFLVEKLSKTLGADYAFGVEVGIENDVLTGKIWGDVIQNKGKALVLDKIAKSEGLSLKDCVVVADDRNNASIFLKEVRKIGYNPDFVIRAKADAIVTGRFSKILPAVNREAKSRNLPSKNDLVRETIHGSGFFIPLIALWLGLPIVAFIIVAMITVYVASEWARLQGKNMPVISTITRHAASPAELCEFTLAPIYFAVGILFTLLLFPARASHPAIAIFALGDSTASLIGSSLSGRPLPFNRAKTLEGSFGGFIFAFLAGSLFVSPWLALAGAAVAMTVEYLPLPVNDNVLMPLFTGLALTLL